jgi:hypothetical protein
LIKNAIDSLSKRTLGNGITALPLINTDKRQWKMPKRESHQYSMSEGAAGTQPGKTLLSGRPAPRLYRPIERGEKSPTLTTLQKIADALGVEVRQPSKIA